ncbi:acetoacetyl-CoA synthetase [Hydrogenophaga crassostreae]|uniref:Acetoacetate--CoA ligase n=1 Tax=Hydrogenophaga crassostreae TaxID=1763535 RepID=A0A162SSC2_9BURK|nr:acetoacetate--CoA ligase [Hydrogenophaga crassostreae]AOW11632.1 acetoacetate--CoA ligase [Hydrogenophaga crassostreae]OAD39919.1 acetoacetyl-CoA synthetase [Hydrogenophaga crassostreae]
MQHPTPDTKRPPCIPQIRRYQDWLTEHRSLTFGSYDELWRWTTTETEAFWQSIWDYFDLQSPTPHTAVLEKNVMPCANWFPGAQVNYAQQVFRHVDAAHAAGFPAVIGSNEKGQRVELSWPDLRRQVASLALHLQAQGVKPGDRVAVYLPNIPETMVAFLATISIGGVWSVCAPDMGTNAVLDRFKQIEPKVLIACDGVSYGGRDFDRLDVVAEMRAALPSVTHVILHTNLAKGEAARQDALASAAPCADFAAVTMRDDAAVTAFEPMWLPFDHPLWIVYSSGTTGMPKPIVHGHGGTVVVGLAMKVLHNDVGCSYDPNNWGERFHWYSSTGWVMWNAQTSGLLNGTTCVIYDGNPGGSKDKPDWTTLWRFAAEQGVTFFGAGAAFFANCLKAGVDLSLCGDLSRVRALGTTGSPLSEDAQNWGTDQFRKLHAQSGKDRFSAGPPQGESALSEGSGPHEAGERGGDIWWCNISGGTDFAGAFIGANRELPQIPGRMQCRMIGSAVESWDEQGQPVIDAVGELVCAQPIPSMPLYFVGDTDNQRLLGSYFDTYPEGHGRKPGGGDLDKSAGAVWRHGDWLRIYPDGSCVIYGRSDATINRHGLRMGTSELYSAVEALPEVLDSMVVDLEYLGRESYMPLFVVLREGHTLNDAMTAKINGAIRTALSPRFLPNAVFQVAEIPRTLSGKKQELPIKKLLLGQPVEKVINKEAMANPGCLDWFVAFAASREPGQKA